MRFEPLKCCRLCGGNHLRLVLDLGATPLANSFLSEDDLPLDEPAYALGLYLCESCRLLQAGASELPERIFSQYAYFSSYSDSWLTHASSFASDAIGSMQLGSRSFVVEVASNDGYLLRNFVKAGIPCLGIDPAANVAAAAIAGGVPTKVAFFGQETASELVAGGIGADLVIAINVLAHVPDIHDFVGGFKTILKPSGVLCLEFPHLPRLIEGMQFDTIYHEHFSYFSFTMTRKILGAHGLEIFDVRELPTHGGSLRIYARHSGSSAAPVAEAVGMLIEREEKDGYNSLAPYLNFGNRGAGLKGEIVEFLAEARNSGRKVAAYGAPAKGNTMLNYCGIGRDLIAFTVDRNPYKQGRYLPGSRIPVFHPERIFMEKPDYLVILPWNLKDEIVESMKKIRRWGGKFVTLAPEVTII
ncbi:MAG: class I SAM-dependent methyltransferase [Nitrospirae bacterium]|nr:class I SAM-dependent methyltransferase [Nitrospirota bacterium]